MNDKELKKSFHKAMNFEHLIVFLLVACLAFSMCFGFACHAESVEQNNSTLGDMFDFNYSPLSFSGWQNSIFNDGSFTASYLPNMTGGAINWPLNIDTSDFTISPKQFIFVNRSGWSLGIGGYLLLIDNANVVAITGNNCFGLATTDGSEFNVECILYNNDLTINNSEEPITYSSSGGIFTFTSNRRIDIYTASCDIYGSRYNYNLSDAVTNIVLASDPLQNGFEMNYAIYDENGELEYNNPFYSGGSSGETSENNLYLIAPKWYFMNIPNITSLGSYYLHENSMGTATFNCKLTDYQKEHLSEFYLVVTIKTYVSLEQQNDDLGISPEKYSRTFEKSEYHLPLSSFYEDGNSYNVLISDVFELSTFTYPTNSARTDILKTWLHSFDNTRADQLNKLQGQFSVYLSDGTQSSGACTYIYDYMNGKSFMRDNSLGTNPNPYFDDDNEQSFDGFDNDNSDVVSNGGNTLINNDNDSIVIESNGEVAERVVNQLIPSNDSGYGLAERIEDYTESNNFLALLKTTYSYIPEQVFDYMQFYFEVSLGILAVAFVLRIILDLL